MNMHADLLFMHIIPRLDAPCEPLFDPEPRDRFPGAPPLYTHTYGRLTIKLS